MTNEELLEDFETLLLDPVGHYVERLAWFRHEILGRMQSHNNEVFGVYSSTPPKQPLDAGAFEMVGESGTVEITKEHLAAYRGLVRTVKDAHEKTDWFRDGGDAGEDILHSLAKVEEAEK